MFEDEPIVKYRPVLVISPEVAYIISVKITSHAPRQEYNGEYRIQNWQTAGRKKESTIRISKILELLPTDFIHKIGMLHPADIFAVQEIWASVHQKKR